MNLNEALEFFRKNNIVVFDKTDKKTDPIGYPKEYGDWEYILFMNGDKAPFLLTNSNDELIKYAEELKKELNGYEI